MSTGAHLEIERKYLIRYPDLSLLSSLPGRQVWEITQTYLNDGEGGQTRRVRRVICDGETRYFRTFKRRVSALSADEDEAELTPEEYKAHLHQADRSRVPVIKTRYRIPHRGHVVEIDVFPFWKDRALMEIELASEDESADIPDYVQIIREVSGEKAYKNRQLARRVPMEDI